jgi:hypothetical protein
MNENVKTLAFIIVALAAVALAAFTAWSPGGAELAEDMRGQELFPDFKQPLDVASLEIITFDEDTATVHPFMVAEAEVKGKTYWVIPSHDNYPADAKDQVAAAAAGLMGLKALEVVSENIGDQREYGVVDPDSKTLKVGDTGVGRRVVMRDKAGKELLSLVIGKEVAGQAGQVYVRKPGEDQIYVVEARTDRLSTKFEDWIERNLLGINSWDIKQLWIRDYSVDLMNQELAQRGDARIEYDDAGQPRWKLLEARKFVLDPNNPEGDHFEPITLGADEELASAKLDELKTALDDLKIVDVAPKPAGLSADLKAAADFSNNREAVQSLARKGFYVAKLEGRVELFSNQGEIRVTMKDGVEYVLRFGDIAGRGAAKKDDKKDNGDENGEKSEEKDKTPGMNRYLFVMAEFNPNIIPKPQLEPLPELKPADKPAEEKAPAAEAKDAKPDEKKPDEKPADVKKENPDDKTTAEAKAVEAERKRIEVENKRKQDEYDRIVAEGKKRVEELNARFADWYYIIDDGVFRRIHLGREELIKKKEPKKPKDHAHDDEHAEGEHPSPETDEPPLPAAPVAPEQPDAPKAEQPKETTPPEAPKTEPPKEPAPAERPQAAPPKKPAPAEGPKTEPPVAPDPPPSAAAPVEKKQP